MDVVSTLPAGSSTACRRFALDHRRRVDPSCWAGCVAAHPSGQTCARVDRSGGSHAGHLPTPRAETNRTALEAELSFYGHAASPANPTNPADAVSPADAVRSR
jgi:hypothetical protein